MKYPLTHPWFEAHFIHRAQSNGSYYDCNPYEGEDPVEFKDAQGLRLWCPCGIDERDKDGNLRYPLDLSLNKGRPHGCLIMFRNPPSGILPPPNFGPMSRYGKNHPRWTIVSGSGLVDLTLTPSIDVGNPSCWHGYIKNGIVT